METCGNSYMGAVIEVYLVLTTGSLGRCKVYPMPPRLITTI